jgi:hypothetical protein
VLCSLCVGDADGNIIGEGVLKYRLIGGVWNLLPFCLLEMSIFFYYDKKVKKKKEDNENQIYPFYSFTNDQQKKKII